MSQFDFGNLESPLTGTSFINGNLEPWRDALHSLHSGSSRPSYAIAGTMWVNNTTNPWVLNVFDGTDDISLGTLNTSTNIYTPSNTIQLSDNNTFTGDIKFEGDITVNDVLAETTAGFSLKDSNGNTCLSGGAGGAANTTLGGNMSGASTHKLVDMADPTAAQDYVTKAYSDKGPFTWQATKTDTSVISTGTFTDLSGLSITLTPDSVDDDFMVFLSVGNTSQNTTSNHGIPVFILVRDDGSETTLLTGAGTGNRFNGHVAGSRTSAANDNSTGPSAIAIDSPNTTDEITYKVKWARSGSSGTGIINARSGEDNSNVNIRTVSTLHVMKVKKQ